MSPPAAGSHVFRNAYNACFSDLSAYPASHQTRTGGRCGGIPGSIQEDGSERELAGGPFLTGPTQQASQDLTPDQASQYPILKQAVRAYY